MPALLASVSSAGGSARGGGGGRLAEEQRKEKRQPRPAARRRRRRGSAEGGGSSDGARSFVDNSSDHHSSSHADGGVAGCGSLVISSVSETQTRSVADRCSFGSDHDAAAAAFVSHVTPLAGRERAGGGHQPDSDQLPGPSSSSFLPFPDSQKQANPSKESALRLKEHEGEEKKELVSAAAEEAAASALDSTSNSFPKALRECKHQKCRSEAPELPGRKPRRHRPASVDFNGLGADVSVLSPRFFTGGLAGRMKSSTASSRSRSGTFPSPGTPNYRHGLGVAGYQKGWSSERVPLQAYSTRRYGANGVFVPLYNGRILPSKWEDAERWILSPVMGDGVGRLSAPPAHLRRPKSKSGPLGNPPGISMAYSSASPLIPCFDNGRVRNFTANSPFLAGVLMPVNNNIIRGGIGRGGPDGGAGGRSYSANGEPHIGRSASLHEWSDTLIESSSSLPNSRDEKSEGTREAASALSPVLKKDAATQMSPEDNSPSPKDRLSFSHSLQSAQPVGELERHSFKLEVRDVQVDDRVTVTRWSKRHMARGTDGHFTNPVEWKKTEESENSTWQVSETPKSVCKYKREEAKIVAWENLQKAKAEAEIRKLEMKLEKKRSSSMEKILNKLRSAQKKAQELRDAENDDQFDQVPKISKKGSYFRRKGQISSLSGCFTCRAC